MIQSTRVVEEKRYLRCGRCRGVVPVPPPPPPKDFCGDAPLDPRGGTSARPGSDEKIEVMRDRAARGCQLHHPDDVGYVDSTMLDLWIKDGEL